jgi:hypothetical protein
MAIFLNPLLQMLYCELRIYPQQTSLNGLDMVRGVGECLDCDYNQQNGP